MKKYISIILVITLMVAAFTGCGKASESTTGEKASADGKISVVTTIFPEYDWVKEIVGDNENVDITILRKMLKLRKRLMMKKSRNMMSMCGCL